MNRTDLFPDLDTPSLLVDRDVLSRNLRRMATALAANGCTLRPHFKAHRMPAICRLQVEEGAHGITCAKLGEAELLADLGFEHLLVANQVVGDLKWRRLAHLAHRHRVTVAVDDLETARAMAAVLREHRSVTGVVVEVDVGMRRCGVAPGEPAVTLAKQCAELKGLKLRGLMGYEGHAVRLPRAEKERECRRAMQQLAETAAACRDADLEIGVVSAGGTGTWDITSRCQGVTELQAGTYAVMDRLFREEAGADFDYACTVLATVISRPTEDRAVIDAGRKSIHPSFGMPLVLDPPGAEVTALSSEHGILRLDGESRRLRPGDRIRMVPYYIEGTINLYGQAEVVSGRQRVDRWEVSGRGRSQ
jgi:D-serine deaminase-like pyridoxal phosphate-dependent protein